MPRVMPGQGCTFTRPGTTRGLGNHPGVDSALPMERMIRKTVAQWTTSDIVDPAAGPIAVRFFAINPSPRLRWSITVGWDLDPGGDFTAPVTVPTWQMRAVRIAPGGGATADLNFLFVDATGAPVNRNLPDGYEVDSAVKTVRGVINLSTVKGESLTVDLFGTLVVEARWEPHDAFTNRDEIWQLLERADLQVIGDITQIANSSG